MADIDRRKTVCANKHCDICTRETIETKKEAVVHEDGVGADIARRNKKRMRVSRGMQASDRGEEDPY